MITEIRKKSEELFERRSQVVANGVGVFNTATVSQAKGAIIVDVDGNELIDFAGGIGVVNAGIVLLLSSKRFKNKPPNTFIQASMW